MYEALAWMQGGQNHPAPPALCRIRAQWLNPEGAYLCLSFCIWTTEHLPGLLGASRAVGAPDVAAGLSLVAPVQSAAGFLSSHHFCTKF